ncbi:glycosyl transferase family 1 [Aquimarina sp. AD1]|uniref:glycosyltransferase n=1 Tax=Aquimarina sp. (strain AD1) TaxID=1714848 RepID=UPI000E539FD7|nr:glycosyltransferase [Aquimarina sp. AD1]AXT57335.1 glycosyl transferase family 1 [Aquimarina sp. AD1]RKN04730.1 glycosyl transferase family 1 [Aquimarina sp. AD1]
MQFNKKILVVENLYPLQTRSFRIENSLVNNDQDVDSIMWNRNGVEVTNEKNHFVFTKISRNKFRKLISIYSYYKFIKQQLKKKDYDVLIASHWDMLFLCFLLKKKNQNLVYDNLDMPTHKYFVVRKFFRILELIALLRTDGIIYASRFFKEFYSSKIPSVVIENKPLKYITKDYKSINNEGGKLTVAFLGTLRYIKSLKILMDAVGNLPNMNLIIKGSGFAEELIEYKKQKGYPNVTLEVGWYNYDDLGKLFLKTDLIWAAYPSKDFNVKYAISNKYFESLIFNKPCIFAENTKLGDFVIANNLGFTVDPYNKLAIESLLIKINNNRPVINKVKTSQVNHSLNEKFWEDEEKKLIPFILNL